jgi:hypothetical protein
MAVAADGARDREMGEFLGGANMSMAAAAESPAFASPEAASS